MFNTLGSVVFAEHVSQYFITKRALPNIGFGNFVPSNIVQKGNVMYGTALHNGRGVVIKMENGNTTAVAGSYVTWEPQVFSQITSIDVAEDGKIYVADPNNHIVKVVNPDRSIEVVAGNGLVSANREDADDATQTAFNWPTHVKVGPDGLLYVMDQGIVRRIEADGSTTHVLGKFGASQQSDPYVDGGTATDNYFPTGTSAGGGIPNNVHFMAFNSTGKLFVTSFMSIYVIDLASETVSKYYEPTDEPYTTQDTPISDKSLYSTYALLSGFNIAGDDSIWLAVSNSASVYNQDGTFKYTMSAIVRFHEGIAYTAAGGGTSNIDAVTPGYGHDFVLSSVGGLAVDSTGNIYFTNAGAISNPYPTQTGSYIGRLSLNTDTTPPEISYTLTQAPNEFGWNNGPVGIDWSVSDLHSDITTSMGCDDITVANYVETPFTCTATSNGGTAVQSLWLNIDATQPAVTGVNLSHNPKPSDINSELTVAANDLAQGSGIRRMEYFFNGSDPGEGNGSSAGVFEYLANGSAVLKADLGTSLLPGTYELNVRVQDFAGNWSEINTLEFEVTEQQEPQTTTLIASADTYIRSGQSNRNHGGDQVMQIQSSGSNRSLVRFDQAALQSMVGNGTVLSAKLRLTITDNGNNWGTTGRTVDIHRLIADWVEGNGTENDRGTGGGATWACAIDSNIFNQAKDCSGSSEWEMGQPNNPLIHPWIEAATDTQTITNGLTGVIEYDVTGDVASFIGGVNQNYGWIIKKTNEGQNGQVSFGTRESQYAAQLVITYQP